MGLGGQRHSPTNFLQGKRPSTHCTGGWVGLDMCGKLRSLPRFDHPTVQLVASRYTHYAFPVQILCSTFTTHDVYGASNFRLAGRHHDTHTHIYYKFCTYFINKFEIILPVVNYT